MNEAVAGSYIEENPESLLASNPDFLSQFTLVIATQTKEQDSVKLDETCRGLKVPLLLARSYGLAGYLRASLPEHLVIESKPENIIDDLRLNEPFEELAAFARSFDLGALDGQTYSHLPYAILLLHASDKWRLGHGGLLPTPKEGRAFKELVSSMKRTQEDGIALDVRYDHISNDIYICRYTNLIVSIYTYTSNPTSSLSSFIVKLFTPTDLTSLHLFNHLSTAASEC